MKKVVVRLKGGLGNQLFSYSAARRLASVNGAELVLDSETGFADDHVFRNEYALDRFRISARLATAGERLEPFSRYRRRALKLISRRRSFERRIFLEEESQDFDPRLLGLRLEGTLYLEGYWQSERYFHDVASLIRHDLRIIPPADGMNQAMATKIQREDSAGMHVRWFDVPGSAAAANVAVEYYRRAIEYLRDRVETPHFYLFSDRPKEAARILALSDHEMTVVAQNSGHGGAFADLWLMTHCKHFVCANSTFSWWGAWLGASQSGIVVAPDGDALGAAWIFPAEVPGAWRKL